MVPPSVRVTYRREFHRAPDGTPVAGEWHPEAVVDGKRTTDPDEVADAHAKILRQHAEAQRSAEAKPSRPQGRAPRRSSNGRRRGSRRTTSTRAGPSPDDEGESEPLEWWRRTNDLLEVGLLADEEARR